MKMNKKLRPLGISISTLAAGFGLKKVQRSIAVSHWVVARYHRSSGGSYFLTFFGAH
jgi:hypothetical protein